MKDIIQDDDNEFVWLHQKQYIFNILRRHGMTEAKPAATPADINVKLVKNDGSARILIQVHTNQW